jgi:hypothetical protein
MGVQVKLPMVVEVDKREAEDLVNSSTAKWSHSPHCNQNQFFAEAQGIALQ